MRKLYAVLFFLFLTEAVGAEEFDENLVNERLTLFKSFLDEAKKRIGVEDRIHARFVEGRREMVTGTHFAEVSLRSTLDGVRTYAVTITKRSLAESEPILLEHVAYHEICHVKRRDPEKHPLFSLTVEREVERCVFESLGEERYAEYYALIASKLDWNFWRLAPAFRRKIAEQMVRRIFAHQ